MNTKEILERLIELQERYSFEKRHLVTGDRYVQIIETGLVPEGDFGNPAVREPLLEHVGHLPVLAAFLHPYLEHSKEIDLGRVLIMLAIHDIGETEVGDVFTYDKTDSQEDVEFKAAMKLIEPEQQVVYQEYEERISLEAKYAKCIDALAPVVHSVRRPQIKIDNFRMKGRVVQDIIDKKTQYFEWDQLMKEIFELCMEHYLKIEQGETGIFKMK